MNFVIPYYPIFTMFAIYTYNVGNLDNIFLPDYILSCIETFLLVLLVVSHRRSEEFNKSKKVLTLCILCFGLASIIYYFPLSLVCIPTSFELGSTASSFNKCDPKLYITRSIIFFIQLVLAWMFPIKFPVAPAGSPDSTPPPYVEYSSNTNGYTPV